MSSETETADIDRLDDLSAALPGRGTGAPRLAAGSRIALGLAARIEHGTLEVTTPEGVTRRFTGRETGPVGRIAINRPRFVRRLMVGGNIGLGEAYMDGDFDSPDLTALLTVGALNETALAETLRGNPLHRAFQRVMHRRNRNSRQGSRRNIAYHYDLGNRFYEAWLDPSMTYSAALFDERHRSLEAAQANKYDALLDALDAGPDHHILEIGCGWGGFAEHAAATRGCRVTAITISRAQHDYARARIQAAGLGDRVAIRLCDYRDVTERFDRIASVEMLEAVGEAYWPTFFRTLNERLAPGGRAALQTITIADRFFESYRSRPDFIQRYIFPGGMLPTPATLHRDCDRAGLRVERMSAFGLSYADTLAAWNERFQAAWPRIEAMGYDARFKRMWEYYLAYCEAGFRAGSIDVQHLLLGKH